MQLILISKSPRRKEILKEYGYRFTPLSLEVSEIIDKNLSPALAIGQVATDKMTAFLETAEAKMYQNDTFLTADTAVINNGEFLGKPKTLDEAFSHIKSLSGKKHSVITGVRILCDKIDLALTHTTETYVEFNNLTDDEIWNYVNKYKPLDKAGAYGIQDNHQFIKEFHGCEYNVKGLPITDLEKIFESAELINLLKN